MQWEKERVEVGAEDLVEVDNFILAV